jgi:deoxyribodipyrimidine photo-lyase
MFLTKDLLIDWRRGEQYFADKLLDFELASNNGGWQWSSSTGVDAQPYFRVFNPLLQSQKFDPEGKFIREWCPELNHLDNKAIHWPFTEDGLATLDTPNDYPMPIVLHREQKDRAIAMFKVGK